MYMKIVWPAKDSISFSIQLFVYFRQRYAPKLYKQFHFDDIPLSVFRAALKKQYINNAHLTDFRVIDRKIAECRQVKHFFFLQFIMFAEYGKGACCTYKFHRLLLDSGKKRFWVNSKSLQFKQNSVDSNDIKAFAKLSPDWTKEDGSFKALYSMNRLRLPLIVDTIGCKTEQSHVISRFLSWDFLRSC
ncbi:unnamed protein product [Wuchereria bancrofti]|uniref:Uncharacterized protein n=1 Tax=Wuchereria bancrofti TaxID=6293 RepID=A0A3P7EJM2_WUCBA|nr:unnamed protein product [Wuchereria bancrofti]